MLRILFVSPAYEPAWALGGVVMALSTLARAIVAEGHHVSVYATNMDGAGGELPVSTGTEVDVGGVKVRYFRPTFGTSLFDSRELGQAIQQTITQFDVVYIAATWQWIGIATVNQAVQQNVPVVMFTSGAFDQMLFQEKKAKKSVWYHLFLKRALDRSAAIHLATPYERQQSHRFVSQWNNFVVPHCINAEQFQPIANAKQSIKQRYGIPESAALLMAAGRIDAKKRLDILFEAMALSKDREEFHLLVVGQDVGELAEQLKSNCRRLNLDNKVTWTGLISTDQMAAYYSAADLLVHLSVDENFGMVVAEAMACGTPVLVTPGVGVWHTVSDASVGRCVDLTTKAVADGLTHFHDNRSTWRSWGENANQVAHARFSPPSVASAMITAFSDVIQSQQSVDCDWFIPQ